MADTYIQFTNSEIKIFVDGTEVARIKSNGDIDFNGVLNDNVF